jgi:ankyrin repeat protein
MQKLLAAATATMIVFCGFTGVGYAADRRSDVNAPDERGRTPLHVAAREGSLERAQLLLKKNRANPNARDMVEQTPLHAAARFGQTEVAELLLRSGADLEAKDMFGKTAMDLATKADHRETVELLRRQQEADAEQARAGGRQRAVIRAVDALGRSLLHEAVMRGYIVTVKYLVENGADLEARDCWGYTPLHLAAEYGHAESVRLLLEHGAKANALTRYTAITDSRETPLDLANKYQHKEAAEVLREYGGTE